MQYIPYPTDMPLGKSLFKEHEPAAVLTNNQPPPRQHGIPNTAQSLQLSPGHPLGSADRDNHDDHQHHDHSRAYEPSERTSLIIHPTRHIPIHYASRRFAAN